MSRDVMGNSVLLADSPYARKRLKDIAESNAQAQGLKSALANPGKHRRSSNLYGLKSGPVPSVADVLNAAERLGFAHEAEDRLSIDLIGLTALVRSGKVGL